MQAGTIGDTANRWSLAMFRIIETVEPRSAPEQAAYSKWLDQRSDRQDARADRTHGAEGVIPAPLWIVLQLSAVVIFVFMLFFADSAERAVVQGMMMGAVAIVITSTLLLLWFLDTRTTPAPAASDPPQWNAQSASSTRRRASSVESSRSPAMNEAPRRPRPG
jgi:hypothetical protein